MILATRDNTCRTNYQLSVVSSGAFLFIAIRGGAGSLIACWESSDSIRLPKAVSRREKTAVTDGTTPVLNLDHEKRKG